MAAVIGGAVVAFVALQATLCGCDLVSDDPPPYVISRPVCVAGQCEGYYRFAGIDFDFRNTGKVAVAEMDVRCRVYDPVTKKNPFVGSNDVSFSYRGSIAQGATASLRISLDEYAHVAPAEPYLVDFFTVRRIEYADGSTWEDPAGVYYARSY